MKFIADSMLGRLARWLRLLGYDTEYFPHIEDGRLIRIAREESRMLLTRDTRLVKIRGLKDFLLLSENDTFEQLRNVIRTFNLTPCIKADELKSPSAFSRCSLCNAVLNIIPKEHAKAHVPEYVYLTSDSFKRCPKCGRFYWKGTHSEKMREKLREIL
jgi:hypothetical protein